MKRCCKRIAWIVLGFLTICPVEAARSFDISRVLTTDLGLEGRVMWVDGAANLARTTNAAGVADMVSRCKAAHINLIVVDVKPVVGQVLYNSRIATHLTTWKGIHYPNFDVLQAFINDAHQAGIAVAANFNVFSEGHKMFGIGLAYQRPQWQSIACLPNRTLIAADGSKLPIRTPGEPSDPSRPLIYQQDEELPPLQSGKTSLAVLMSDNQRVEGYVNPSLWGAGRLQASDGGQILLLGNSYAKWAVNNLHPGDRDRFRLQTQLVPITQAPDERIAAFVNPILPAVQAYELSLIKEVVSHYDVDAIVLDRMRYADIYNDFSPASRTSFSQWTGHPVQSWPGDVLSYNPIPGDPIIRGPLFKRWLQWRALQIQHFLGKVVQTVHQIKPQVLVGAYVGSWYGDYYPVGVNWGSPRYSIHLNWTPDDYSETGYADYLDFLTTGCYYKVPTLRDAQMIGTDPDATVEAAARLSEKAVHSATYVYAGIYLQDFAGHPKRFADAVKAAIRNSQGVMLFDISYVYDYHWWPILDRLFAKPVDAPHEHLNLLAQIRSAVAGSTPPNQ